MDMSSHLHSGDIMDRLWRTAEQLGRVSIEEEQCGIYCAEIQFSHKSSLVFARGKSTDVCQALSTAIRDARDMGAKENNGRQ